jgi:hypothetical protein
LKGYLTKEVLAAKLPPPSLGPDVKIFVCGPPGQVAAVAGPKDDMKQGELQGMLKDLGFSQDQVYKVHTSPCPPLLPHYLLCAAYSSSTHILTVCFSSNPYLKF